MSTHAAPVPKKSLFLRGLCVNIKMTVDQQLIDDIIKQTILNQKAQPAAIAPVKSLAMLGSDHDQHYCPPLSPQPPAPHQQQHKVPTSSTGGSQLATSSSC